MLHNHSLPVCPYCGGTSRYKFSSGDLNRRITPEQFRYYLCNVCSLIFIEPVPGDLGRFYLNEQYDIPVDGSSFQRRAESQLWKVDILKKLIPPGPLFEVGPATGEFAFAARQAGFRPRLAEMDEQCCGFLRAELGLDATHTPDPAGCLVQEGSYDAICIWQAIEHIPEFWKLLDIAAERVAEGGVIVISTPNPISFQAHILGRCWPHLDAPRHVYLIPQEWFRSFARKRGLSVVFDTTRDVGSIGLNYYGWYLAVRNLTRGMLNDRVVRVVARGLTRLFRRREESEGAGCSYTIAFRKPATVIAHSADPDQDASLKKTLKEMVVEVENGSSLHRPSRFWQDLNEINSSMLGKHGLENFKRTVAQNYFNWLVISEKDPQYRSARKLCQDVRHLKSELVLEMPDLLRTVLGVEERADGSDLDIYKQWPVEAFPKAMLEKIGEPELEVYKLFVGMLWDYSVKQDWSGIEKRVVEPLSGNPIRLFLRGKLISQDLANSIREYNAILSDAKPLASSKKRVAELGAGYGRVAHVFLSDEHTQYFVFDIPPALYVSQWYLGSAHPDKKVFRFRHFERIEDVIDELVTCDMAFFTPNQIELFPDGFFDIFASISTLPEMTKEQIENYLRQAERVTSRYIYLKQWLNWENALDGHRVTPDTIKLRESWTRVFDRTDAIQTAFFERLWRRKGTGAAA